MIQFVQLSHPKGKPTYVRGGFVDEEKKGGQFVIILFSLSSKLPSCNGHYLFVSYSLVNVFFFFFSLAWLQVET